MVRVRVLWGIGLWLLGQIVLPMPAAANPFLIEAEPPAYTSSFALRYWYGMGSASKDLYGLTRDTLNSRLTYDGMRSHSAEIFARVDATESSFFWKAYVGGGLLTNGTLQDEDFPPGISPYSSTNSTLQNQGMAYASADFGGAILRGADFRLDGFVGYHYLNEHMKAFGCQQTASNTSVCNPAISDSVAVITQENTWQALRLGLNADLPLVDRFRLNLEAVWLPYVWFTGSDSHLLRIGSTTGDFTGAIPEDGHGTGYQFEAVLSYRIDDQFDIGIGGRYWHMDSRGYAHFEGRVVNTASAAQPLDWKSDHYGVFVQGNYKFGL